MKRAVIYICVAALAAVTSCYYIGPCVDGVGVVIEQDRDVSGFYGVSNTTSVDVHVMQADTFSVVVAAQENLMPVIETYVSGRTLIVDIQNGICIRSSNPIDVYITMPMIEELSLTGSGTLEAGTVEAEDIELSLTGSGDIFLDSITTTEAIVSCTSSGEILVSYIDAPMGTVRITGSGDIEVPEFYVTDMEITHTSSGDIRLGVFNAAETDGTLTGSGRLILDGDTEMASFSHTSSGQIDAFDLTATDVRVTSSGSGDTYVYATHTLDVTILGSGDVFYGGNPLLSYRDSGSGDLRKFD